MTKRFSQRLPHGTDTRRGAAAFCAAALLLFVLAPLLAGCKTTDEQPLDPGPISSSPKSSDSVSANGVDTGGAEAAEDAAALQAAQNSLAAAQGALRDGDPLSALAIASRAIVDGVPDSIRSALRAVRTLAREALLQDRVLRLQVLPDRDAVADGGDIGVTVRLRNLSAAPLRVPVTAEGSSNSVVVLEVLRSDYDVYGNVREAQFTVRVQLEEDIELTPGGEATLRAEISGERARLGHMGFSVLRIGGHLRPVGVQIGATEFFDALPLEPALVRVFMQGYEPLAADPLTSLRRSVQKRSPPHVLTAAELLAPDERAEGIRFLEGAAEDDAPMATVLEAAANRLRQLAGE